jgi:agmatinase
VREASRLLRPYNPAQDVTPFSTQQVVDAGDISANPFDLSEAVAQIQQAATELSADGKRLVTIGGDHTIALPLLRVVAEKHGPIAVLHFDAHLDTWDTYFGAPITHGTPFRRASEEGLIDMHASMHVGIRGPLYSRDDLRDDERLGFAIISSVEIETEGLQSAIERMLARLGDRPVYVSVDIDVLDPAHAPGTGTPEAGGMTSRELLAMLRALRNVNIVGADVVEVAPAYDHAQITAVAASHVAYEIISAMTPSTTV